MKTEVVNKRTHVKTKDDVYIGRGSKWGNPFIIGKHGNRAEVIKKYKEYITGQPALLNAVHELAGKKLVCYCAPLACHGHILCELIEKGE